MATRTSEKTVIFRRPFVLGECDEVLPAGAYTVETDEELLEGVSFTAYRRILTLLQLLPKPGRPGLTEKLAIDPKELDAALERDKASAEALLESPDRRAHRIRKRAFFVNRRIKQIARVAMENPTKAQ